jgi:hypothetical protein
MTPFGIHSITKNIQMRSEYMVPPCERIDPMSSLVFDSKFRLMNECLTRGKRGAPLLRVVFTLARLIARLSEFRPQP